MSSSRPLVIFGLRGTLLERLHKTKVPPEMPDAVLSVGMHKVWTRPHLLETLGALSDHCDLAIWSSTTARNTSPVVEAVFSGMTKPFRFVWTREHTTSDEFRRSVAAHKDDEHATLKDLTLVLQQFPEYSLDRVVLVDDTPSKARLQAANFVWLESFQDKNIASDSALLSLKEFLVRSVVPAGTDVRTILPQRILNRQAS